MSDVRRVRYLGLTVLLSGAVLVRSASEANIPDPLAWQIQFTDATHQAGLNVVVVNGGESTKKYIFESTGSGIASFDYDQDGFCDIFLVNGSRLEGFSSAPAPSNYLFRNSGHGTFADVTEAAGLTRSGWGQGVCVGDYDNDGFDDLFVTYFGSPNVLYHNNGNGTFTDITGHAGLSLPGRNWSTGCAFLDYDRDGKLDLFVANYVDLDLASAPLPGSSRTCLWKGVAVFCGPRGLPFSRNHLYRNNGNATFTEVSASAGIFKANDCYGLGVATADFGNRGWPDIYVACDSSASLFYRNNGEGTFTERGVEAGVAYNEDGLEQAGMGVSVADYNSDGFLDILKTNFEDDVTSLYKNEGDGTFTFSTHDAKLGFNLKYLSWGGGFFDYDNDGWSDIFIANGHVYPELQSHNHPESPYRQRNLLYHNARNGTFNDVSSIGGPGLQLRRSGRGVAFADFDNDGDLDVAVNNQNDSPTLLRNNGGNKNHWLSVRLVGTLSNRDGIGARIAILAGGRRQIAEIHSGGSYLSQNDLRVHFGLGQAPKVDRLEIHWPSGLVDTIRDLEPDRRIDVREGKGRVSLRGEDSRDVPARQ